MARITLKGRSFIGILGVIALLAGCAADKGDHAKEAGGALAETSNAIDRVWQPTPMQRMRQELEDAQLQIDGTLGTMSQLTSASTAALPSAYEVFERQVSQVVVQAAAARRRATEMQEQRQRYVAGWKKEIGQLSTPELRTTQAERRRTVERSYDRLCEAARTTAHAYQPFLTYLKDIQRVLSRDLTPVGVKAARPAFESARNAATNLKQQTANFIDQIDLLLPTSPPKK
jgi:hypothetical protein